MSLRICIHDLPQGECASCIADRARFDVEKHKKQEAEIAELYKSVLPEGAEVKVVGATPDRDTFLISVTLPCKINRGVIRGE